MGKQRKRSSEHSFRKEAHSIRKDIDKRSQTNGSTPGSGNTTKWNPVFPSGETAFKALLSARFCAAIWSHITDCDETFNYWEPMHFLVFGKGLQTWEYSPQFALRSYMYVLIHATPAYIYHVLFQPNPLLIFYFTRCLLGLACAFSEVYFYKVVCKEFGIQVGRIMFVFLLLSAGMFISSTAFLPSSWAMYANTAAMAAWWDRRLSLAVFLTALSSLLGWPFAALLGVPIAIDMLFLQKQYSEFIKWCVITLVQNLLPMVVIDSLYYNRLTIAPFNIIKYNVLSDHGPDLYGTEPLSYYLLNGFLNFNVVWLLALSCPIFLLIVRFAIPCVRSTVASSRGTLNLPYYLSLSPLYLWLVVFFIQPHKEERFLFPVYPMICLTAAISVDALQKLWFRFTKSKKTTGIHYLDSTQFIMVFILIISSIGGVSRILSLYKNYNAPFDLLMELNRLPTSTKNREINLCLGKDWYRFPNSFFLPNGKWTVRFIKSEFDGMLPAQYAQSGNATWLMHSHFNDMNREEPSLYFDKSKCDFLMHLDNTGMETDLEPNYSASDEWIVFKETLFIDSDHSHRLFKAFYVPWFNDIYVKYKSFYLLQNIKFSLV